MVHKFEVAEVVPHANTMSLLTEIRCYAKEWVETSVTITRQTLFCQAEGVPAWVGMEYMAQTVAAYAGIQEKLQGRMPKIGFLLGTRRYQSSQPFFPSGSMVVVQARLDFMAENGLGVFDCTLSIDGTIGATAKLSVFQPENIHTFLLNAKYK